MAKQTRERNAIPRRPKPKPFPEVLAALADSDQPLTASITYGLSSLDRQQIERLETEWRSYPVERRRGVISHLNDVSEANFDMDFRAINHLALVDPDAQVRRAAIEGLWEDESLSLLHKLVRIVRQDNNPDVRAAAIVELGRFILLGEYEDISQEDAQIAQDTVLEVYNNRAESSELRRRALEAIANCSREGVSDMIRSFYNADDLKMKVSAVFAMGRSCDDAWGPEILREIASSEPELRYEAARSAGQMELKQAVPLLGKLIEESNDTELIEVAIWSLGEIGGEAAERILNRVLSRAESRGDDELAAAAQEALDAASLSGEFLLFDFEQE